MTIPYPAALTAIRLRSAAQLRQAFDGITIGETVELGTFISARRLHAVGMLSQGETAALLIEINQQAFVNRSAHLVRRETPA